MKNIKYNSEDIFCITDAEFDEARKFWQSGSDYYCVRIKVLLTKKYIFVNTPFEQTCGRVAYKYVEHSFDGNNYVRDVILNTDGSYFFWDKVNGYDLFTGSVNELIPLDTYYENRLNEIPINNRHLAVQLFIKNNEEQKLLTSK